MKDRLISLETAKIAKVKKFNWDTVYYHCTINGEYDKDDLIKGYTGSDIPATNWNKSKPRDMAGDIVELYSAPPQSLLQKWLREEYDIHVAIYPLKEQGWCGDVRKLDKNDCYVTDIDDEFEGNETYEDALEIGLKLALKRIKSK